MIKNYHDSYVDKILLVALWTHCLQICKSVSSESIPRQYNPLNQPWIKYE